MISAAELRELGFEPPRPRLCWRLQCRACGHSWDAYGLLRDQRCEPCARKAVAA